MIMESIVERGLLFPRKDESDYNLLLLRSMNDNQHRIKLDDDK